MRAIEVNNLTKAFGHLVAVDHISFEVGQGEIFGFLGVNGSGKTTTMMMLATALNPSSGTATVWGYDIIRQRSKVRESIGVVFQKPSLDVNLTGKENLDFHARMYHLDKKTREGRISRALNLVGLEDRQNTLAKHYSGGMQRKLEIARGMLNYPKVLFLDEPTLGLDVQTRRLVWDYVRKLKKDFGTTILLNTHYIEEADNLCDSIAIVEGGKIIALDSPQSLRDSVSDSLLSIRLSRGSNGELAKLFDGISWIKQISKRDDLLELRVQNGAEKIPDIVRLAEKNALAISSISERKPTLEDAFLRYTGRAIRGEEAYIEEGEQTTRDRRK
jgi:ABC-2 type transport system ATP-binding protein